MRRVGDPNVTDVSAIEPVLRSLPREEQKSAGILITLLLQMSELRNEFVAAASLKLHTQSLRSGPVITDPLEAAETSHLIDLWEAMAHRDAALCIYNISEALKAIRGAGRDVPSLLCDHGALREAAKSLIRQFPSSVSIRHSIGHRAEMIANLKQFRSHAVGGTQLYLPQVDGERFTATYRGEMAEMLLNDLTVQHLSAIIHLVYKAFPALTEKLPKIPLRQIAA